MNAFAPSPMDASLTATLASGIEICRVTVDAHWGALGGLFLTGLIGSLVHCSGMCGPFVLSQVGARLEAVDAPNLSESRRVMGALLVPYHLGRATTYMLLGGVAASVLGHLAGGGMWLNGLSALMLAAGALVLIGMAFPQLALHSFGSVAPLAGLADWVAKRAKPLIDRPTGFRAFGLGVLLGFIPCGLLYAALSAAAALGNGLAGAFGMLAFTLGTVPMLVVIGIGGHLAARKWRQPFIRLAPWLLLVNGLVLGMLAGVSATRLFYGDSF